MNDSKGFFEYIRKNIFNGKMTASQVEGVNFLMAAHEAAKWPISWGAYSFATAYHETGATMQPITEWGSRKYFDKYDSGRLARILGNTAIKDGDGFKYRGRGYTQLTGKTNYSKAGAKIGKDLVKNPDLMLDDDIAAIIHIWGLENGIFTGKKLADYLPKSSGTKVQFVAARKTVNGNDDAALIANIALKFQAAIILGMAQNANIS